MKMNVGRPMRPVYHENKFVRAPLKQIEGFGANGWRLPHWRYKSRKDFFSNQAKRIRNDKISTIAPLRQPRVSGRRLINIHNQVHIIGCIFS
jgi:hypothetical protein